MMRPSTTTAAGSKPNAASASASSPSASSRNAASPTPASVRGGAGASTRKTSPPPTPTSGSKDALSPASSGMYPSPSASGRRGSTVTGLDGGGATPTSGSGAGNNTHRDPFANTNKSMLTTMSGTLATTSGGGGGGSENIKVYVRLRDYNAAEKERWIPNDLAVRMGGSTCEVTVPGRGKFPFTFDECFWSNSMEEEGKPYADQCDVYDAVGAPLVANVMAGFNSSIIAYGQTGSGKTYSIFGPSIMDEEGTKKGLIPRVCDGIFARLANEGQSSAKYTVSVTMLEVYLEEVFDLLNSRKKLAVRQDTATSFGVVGAKSQEVKNYHEVLRLIEKGDSHKTFAATAMNERSSRAHTLFQLVVSVVTPLGSRSAKVMLADLAGCERIKIAKTDTGTALDEACNINLSLLTLGTCIEAAVLRSKQGKSIENMGEFRQSTLTKLLKDFIGGNSRTAILVAIAPALKDVNLTLQALRFADRAKQITTHAKINYVSNKDGPNNKIADEALKTLYDNKKELLEKEYQLECAQNELRVRQDEVANTKIKLDEERRVIAERCKLAETSEEEKKMLLARVSEIEQTMKDMTQELIDMEKEKESMREKILEVCQDNAAIVSDKEVLERRVNELQLRLQDLEDERNDELVAAQDKNYMLTQEVERLEEKLQAREAHHARLAEEAKAAHEKALQEQAEAHKKALEAKEADMNSKIAALEKQLNASRQQCFSLTASLVKKTSEYEKLEKDTAAASADKDAAHKKVVEELNTTFNAKVADLEAKLAKVQDDLKKESAAKISTERSLFDLRKVHEDTNKAQKDEIASLTSDLQKSVDKAKKDAEAHNEALAAKTAAHKSAHQALISLNGSLGQSLNSIAEAVAAAYDEKGQLAFTSFASLQQVAHSNAIAHTDGLTKAHDKAAAESAASSKTASEKAAAEHKAALKEKDDRVSRRDATIKDLEAKAAKKAKETEATIASMTAAHAEEVARLKGSASASHAQQRGHADALAAEANAAQEMLKAALEKFHAAMAAVPAPAA